MDSILFRKNIRNGNFTGQTSGECKNFVQTNVVILDKKHAYDFLVFCQRNSKPCPIIEVLDPGDFEAKITAPNSDIRFDVPKYRVFMNGKLREEINQIDSYWNKNLVTFLLGCSFSFEHELVESNFYLPYYNSSKTVPMYNTNIPTIPSGDFAGNMVVTLRWIHESRIDEVVEISSKYTNSHGSPVHIGDPEKIGIKDIKNPDYGNQWINDDKNYVPVFWACGVTPQNIALSSNIDFMITHSPGHMFITDLSTRNKN